MGKAVLLVAARFEIVGERSLLAAGLEIERESEVEILLVADKIEEGSLLLVAAEIEVGSLLLAYRCRRCLDEGAQ